MRKSTYASRMKSYIGMLIAFGIGMFVLSIITQLQLDVNKAGTYAMQLPAIETITVAEMDDVDEFIDEEWADEEEDAEEYEEDAQAEIDPDDYDGKIIIATADEVITMTIDNDGIKHFTNHLVG